MSATRFLEITFHYPILPFRELCDVMAENAWSLDFEGKIEYALSADVDMDFDWKTSPASNSKEILDQLDDAFSHGNKVAVRQHHIPTGLLSMVHFGVCKNGLWINVYGEVPLLHRKGRVADVSQILRPFEPLIMRPDIHTCKWSETY